MTQFTQDTVASQDAEARGTRFGYRRLAITVPDACDGKGAGSDPGPGRPPGSGAARAPAGRAALPRAAGFWLVAGVLFLLLFASAAASPLYGVYQAQWRFSATTLTAVALPCMIAAPALNGFYLSLGPSLAAQVLRSPDLLWGGLVIFLVAGSGAAASVAFRAVGGPAAMLAGCLALLAGAVMTLAAIETASAAAFLAGTAVAGAGVGTGFFLGAYRILTALAGPGQRAGLVAAIWVVFYLAFSVPVVVAGVATAHFGLHRTAVVYSAALAAVAAGSFLFRRRSPNKSFCAVGDG